MTLWATTMLWNFVLIFAYSLTLVACVVEPGPKYPPTKGEVWPKAQQEKKDIQFYTFNPSNFEVKLTNYNCTILSDAVQRYSYVYKNLRHIRSKYRKHLDTHTQLLCPAGLQPPDDNYQGAIQELLIDLTAPCEEYPQFDMDESYNLTVSLTATLKSASIWGIIRGLETFAQLFYLTDDFKEVRINATEIVDYPRYAHRGLLLDTSRHYISVSNILVTLDAMAMNKMNVFHWHIVDDQSFPYQSEKFPDLSGHGAYHPSMVYTKSNIQTIVNYARDRGIRVVPEFDVPGHTRSWGVAYPNILTECYRSGELIGMGPMNPIRNTTYKFLRDLFQEIQEWFPDKYFHVGGDEVELNCWQSNPEISDFMRENNITHISQLHGIFMQNTIPLLGNRSKPIVWQEVFDEGVPLSDDTLVQVWKSDWPVSEVLRVLRSGHRMLYSSSWYLDHLNDNFGSYFLVDPRQMVIDQTYNETLAQNIVGGEACMWGEMADDRNFISRVWPRASAVAERLWSPGLGYTRSYRKASIPKEALHRIEEHTCRMIRRGISSEPPSGPGYCLA